MKRFNLLGKVRRGALGTSFREVNGKWGYTADEGNIFYAESVQFDFLNEVEPIKFGFADNDTGIASIIPLLNPVYAFGIHRYNGDDGNIPNPEKKKAFRFNFMPSFEVPHGKYLFVQTGEDLDILIEGNEVSSPRATAETKESL